MKALLVLLATLTLAGLAWYLLGGDQPVPPTPGQSGEARVPEAAAGPNRSGDATPADPALVREGVDTVPVTPTPTPNGSGSAEADEIAVEGRVIHHDDERGVPHATVACASLKDFANLSAAQTTETDDEGRFRFEGIPAHVEIRVASLGVTEVVEPSDARVVTVVLRVPRAVFVEGEVVDLDGHRVAGAEIALSIGTDPFVLLPATRSDGAGRFQVFGLADRTWLRARADGFRASDVILVERRPGPPQTVRLTLAADPLRLTGQVIDARGAAVRGAIVAARGAAEAVSKTAPDGRIHRSGDPLATRSGEDGRFVLDGLPPGRLFVSARAESVGYAETAVDGFGVRGRDVTLRLDEFAALEGSVREADGSVPPALSIGLRTWPRELGTQWASVDKAGNFVLEGVCPGRFQAQVWRNGAAVFASDMELQAGQRGRWAVTLPEPAGVSGVILDPRGSPLADYTVVAWRNGEWLRTTTSDAAGRFELPDLQPGPVTLRTGKAPTGADPRGYALNAASVEVTAPDRRVQIVVGDASLGSATISGTVLAPDGEPLPGAQVQLASSGAGAARLTSQIDGRFRATEVTPGDYQILVRHPDHAVLFVGRRTIRVGEAMDLGDLRMPVSGRLRARVVSEDGVPTDGIELIVLDSVGRQVDTLRMDGDSFRSAPLPVGPAVLGVSGDAIARTRIDVTIAAGVESTVELRVRRGLGTTIAATLPTGALSLSWVWVSIFDAERKLLGGTSLSRSEDGAWRGQVFLAPGHYLIACGTDGNRFGGQIEFDVAVDGALLPITLTAESKR